MITFKPFFLTKLILLTAISLMLTACVNMDVASDDKGWDLSGEGVDKEKDLETNEFLRLQRAGNNSEIVRRSLYWANRYRELNAPIARAASLSMAALYSATTKNFDAAENFSGQAYEILSTLPAAKRSESLIWRQTVENAINSGSYALKNGNKVAIAMKYVVIAKKMCENVPINDGSNICDTESPIPSAYRQLLAKTGDPIAQSTELELETRRNNEREITRKLAARFDAALARGDDKAVLDIGIDLVDNLNIPLLKALVESDRARAFIRQKDKSGSEAAMGVARQILHGLNSIENMELVAKEAADFGLKNYANKIEREDKAVRALMRNDVEGVAGISVTSTFAWDWGGQVMKDPGAFHKRLVDAENFLKSRGAEISAGWINYQANSIARKYSLQRETQTNTNVSDRSNSAASLTGNTVSTSDTLNGAPCRPTMTFLEARIPNFSAPELQQMRQAILAENVKVTMSKAKAQGFTIQGAIKATLDQAKEFDRVSRQAAQCAADVDALGATDDSFLASMQQGKAPRACSGIRNSCLCAGVINRMSAVGARALAAEMQCFARRGE